MHTRLDKCYDTQVKGYLPLTKFFARATLCVAVAPLSGYCILFCPSADVSA